ncbi:MAG: leucine-rich repeat domain-containing protein [Muribaculaceae bacterium]|nr:leucine-rich repeat domain-containing protein [Muribaculaceae bacterium]
MKKLLLTMLGLLLSLPTIARDFEYTYKGQTITYTVIDEDAKTCKTKDGMNEDGGFGYTTPGNNISGDLILPSNPIDGITAFTLTELGNYAFYESSELTSITVPNSVKVIGENAFCFCFELTSITIPESVNYIGAYAFNGCFGLTSITIPNSVTSIGEGAFYGCYRLTSITIPKSVNHIVDYTFYGCSGLTSFTIPESVTSIGLSAFEICSGLSSITIPDSVTEIDSWAFYDCSGIETVTLSENLKILMEGAFRGCNAIKNVNYKGETPIEATKNVFADSVYEGATLNVKVGKVSSFQEVSPWKYFKNITDKEYSAVDEVIADEDGIDYALPYSVYNLKGQMAGNSIDGLIPGMYIVRQGSKVKKVVVK